MSASTSKRARREENIVEDNPDDSSDASSQGILENGNFVVFDTLIPMMRDLDVLKKCRLICKSWNQFARPALKKIPWACSINEYSALDGDGCLQLLKQNKKLDLPFPFGNIKIGAMGLRRANFLKLLGFLRVNPNNNYSIDLSLLSADVDYLKLQIVLTSNLTANITKLMIVLIEFSVASDDDAFQPEKIQLPHLKTLVIGLEGLSNEKMVTLCKRLCQYSPLNSFEIHNVRCAEKLETVISSGGMKSVENFSLKYSIDSISPPNWKYFCTRLMEIPRITKLSLCFRSLGFNYECYAGFERIIEHYADTLKSLSGDSLPIIKHKRFPQLREIYYFCFGKFEKDFSLPVERYPLLKKVTFAPSIGGQPLEYPCVEEQSPGIEDISIFFEEDCRSSEDRDQMMKFISGAGRVFPNVTSFSLFKDGEVEFSPLLFSAIDTAYLKLTSLDLSVKIESREKIYLGLLLSMASTWEEAGWPAEKIPPSLFVDFLDVEKIRLGRSFVVTDYLIGDILSRIQKLQHLTFYLHNGHFTAKDAVDNLRKLKRITIVIATDLVGTDSYNQCLEQVELLRKKLPGIVELKNEAPLS